MATTPEPEKPQKESMYFITDSVSELARLVEQERYFVKAFGGLLPEHRDPAAFLAPFHRVVDAACGSGGWVLDLATAYPDLEVIGFDIDEHMIRYANSLAQAGGIDNASFRVMNLFKPLDFPDNSVDLVNARFMSAIPAEAWPRAIQEFYRILRPGGFIRLTEPEHYSLTTGSAFEALSGKFLMAYKVAGLSLSPDGRSAGTTQHLPVLFRKAGFKNIRVNPLVINWSAGTEAHEPLYQDIRVFMKLLQPFIIDMGQTTQEEADRLYREAEIEMQSDDFGALWYMLTVWAEKPKG